MVDTKESPLSLRRGLIGLAILALIIVGFTLFRIRTRDNVIPLADLRQGVTPFVVNETPLMIYRDEDIIRVFLTSVPHLPGERGLWWCPSERIFAAPMHGELFAPSGEAIGGPAHSGLTRLHATRMDGHLQIHSDVRETSPRRQVRQDIPLDQPWNLGPDSFCHDPVRSTDS